MIMSQVRSTVVRNINAGRFTFFLMTALMLQCLSTAPASAQLTIRANHDNITVDFFYHGSTIKITGQADAGSDLVIKIASEDAHHVMKKKGKVGGTLWMNVGTIKFDQTPSVYQLLSSKALDEILSIDEQQHYVIGYPALQKHMEISPVNDEVEKARWFDEFVKFQEQQKLYTIKAGGISVAPRGSKNQEYTATTDWPYQAAPGKYKITVYAVKDKKVMTQASTEVSVEQVGIVKTLAGMANHSAAFYGILSIGVALAAGFVVGILFRKGGGSH